MLVPIKAGNSNRQDLQEIANSLLNARGQALSHDVNSIVWIETQIIARAVFHAWAANQKLANQSDPNKMSDYLTRWEKILQLLPLPTDSITTRRSRIAAKFSSLNQAPTTQAITDLLKANLAGVFAALINIADTASASAFPGGSSIINSQASTNAEWFSTISSTFIETIQPTYMTDAVYHNLVNQLYGLLTNYLPASCTFDWFLTSFSDNGAGVGTTGKITMVAGSGSMSGTGTLWNTVVNVTDSTKNVVVGTKFCFYDDNGIFRRVTVKTIFSNTSLGILENGDGTATNKPYWIEGFFLDCDPLTAPFPPSNAKNIDHAGLSKF
jgi:hypothetical protein